MSEQATTPSAEATTPKLKMEFRVESWSIKSRVNRSGREESETISMSGQIYAPTIDADTPLTKAVAQVKLKDAQDRMSIKIGKDQSVMFLPLEDFAMERITAKIKEMSGDYGMALSVEFEANETTDRQLVDFADFTFSKVGQAAAKPAASTARAPAPAAAPAPASAAQAPAAPAQVTR